MTLSGQPAMGSNIRPMPVMQQQQPTYAAPPMFAGQQPVSPQQAAAAPLPDPSQQQPPQFNMQPGAPPHVPQPMPQQLHQQAPQQISQQMPQQVQQQAPQFTLPPADAGHALRISKLAEYTSRNRPAFEEQVRVKQALNPEYSFLQGGEGSSYYQWCLFCYSKGIAVDQPQQVGQPREVAPSAPGPASMMFQQHGGMPPPAAMPVAPQNMLPPVPSASGPIPPDIASGFAQVLHVLQGSQVWHNSPYTALLRSRAACCASWCGLVEARKLGEA